MHLKKHISGSDDPNSYTPKDIAAYGMGITALKRLAAGARDPEEAFHAVLLVGMLSPEALVKEFAFAPAWVMDSDVMYALRAIMRVAASKRKINVHYPIVDMRAAKSNALYFLKRVYKEKGWKEPKPAPDPYALKMVNNGSLTDDKQEDP